MDDLHRGDFVAFAQANAAHAHRNAPLGAQFIGIEAHRIPIGRHEHDRIAFVGECRADEFIALAELNRLEPVFADILKCHAFGLLDDAVLRRHENVSVDIVLRQGQNRFDAFARLELGQHIDDGAPFRRARPLR